MSGAVVSFFPIGNLLDAAEHVFGLGRARTASRRGSAVWFGQEGGKLGGEVERTGDAHGMFLLLGRPFAVKMWILRHDGSLMELKRYLDVEGPMWLKMALPASAASAASEASAAQQLQRLQRLSGFSARVSGQRRY